MRAICWLALAAAMLLGVCSGCSESDEADDRAEGRRDELRAARHQVEDERRNLILITILPDPGSAESAAARLQERLPATVGADIAS